MRAGVHLGNDGQMSDEQWRMIRNMPIVKALVRIDEPWGEIDWRQLDDSIRPDCDVVLRLFFPGRLEAGEFVARAQRKLPPILTTLASDIRNIWIEIHNEPNHAAGTEGWGASIEHARDFAAWYAHVLSGLRESGFTRLGFPGLALGDWMHNERTWAYANRHNIRNSDWLGVHCYWQRYQEIENPQLGENWRWYRNRWPNKRIIVTEAANSGRDGPMGAPSPEEQAAQYARWCRKAAGKVYGVCFYMLGGSEDWRGFEIHPETIWALEGL